MHVTGRLQVLVMHRLPVRQGQYGLLRGLLAHIPFCRRSQWPLLAERKTIAEPLYQRVEHCLKQGARALGHGGTSKALGLDSESHCVVPAVTSPVTELHPRGRTMTDSHVYY